MTSFGARSTDDASAHDDEIALDAVELRNPRQQSPALEAKFLEEAETRLIVPEDEAEECLQRESRCRIDRIGEQRPPDAVALVVWRHVYAHLGSGTVRGAAIEGLEAQPTGDGRIDRGHPERKLGVVLREPSPPTRHRDRRRIGGGEPAGNRRIVDAHDLAKIALDGVANDHLDLLVSSPARSAAAGRPYGP